ncbi:MAG: hypothetical protein QN141_03650 [Armatimonadota bacterium]|nr:hypothetical protein [Armatimonadota bacterium]MDR7451439.1 hypothetical protein [Armatimonadota bacterium]MDR7466411.1 hypothetical protein [Armatimonadota bacterium]MDR7493133.1 hypothetical protein [Armatimonadota bacterium]MDR7498110.1 hypothetical protein [Armatimonadota bacterium]
MSLAVGFPTTDWRSIRIGVLSTGGLIAGYSLIVGLSSRSWPHLLSQWRADLWFIVLVAVGFGAQTTLYTHVRRTLRADGTGAVVAAGGTATSTTAMVACCLHHLADAVPFIGLSAAATFLIRYKLYVVVLSLAANAAGILLMLRALRHARRAAAACH